jgi:hypothetical protein
MVSPPQIPRNAERAQCEGCVALIVEEEQRGQQHTHYKGWDTPKDNPASGHLGSCMAYRGGAMQEFSEVRAVASRNSLYQALVINVAVKGVVEG